MTLKNERKHLTRTKCVAFGIDAAVCPQNGHHETQEKEEDEVEGAAYRGAGTNEKKKYD